MANYCVSADLLAVKSAKELSQLADLDGNGVADDAVIIEACTRATALINSYLSPRYPLPLAGAALAQIKSVAVALAVYFLHEQRGALTEDENKKYDRALDYLRDVQKGTASLGDPIDAAAGDKSPGIAVNGAERIFSRDKMGSW